MSGKTAYALAAALSAVAVFIPTLWNGFVEWDDGEYVYENIAIRSFDGNFLKWAFLDFHSQNWHPLTWLSHALDYAVWGLDPLGHHLTSIILHGINTFFVVILAALLYEQSSKIRDAARSVSEKKILAIGLITGLLFGLHPLRVESVAWVSERKDVLCGLFFLLSVLAHVRYGSESINDKGITAGLANKWYLLSFVSFVLALMSKPMAVTVPLVLLVLDWHPLARLGSWRPVLRSLFEKMPYFIVSLMSAAITLSAQGHVIRPLETTPLGGRILLGIKVLVVYLYKIIWPSNLSPVYPYPEKISFASAAYFVPVLLAAVVTLFGLLALRRQKGILAVWLTYVIMLIPVLGIVQVASIAMADRYTYLPSIGPCLLLSSGLAAGFETTRRQAKRTGFAEAVAWVAMLSLFSLLSYATIRQSAVWNNTITLWSRVIEAEPQYPKAYSSRAAIYGSMGFYEEAVKDCDRAVSLKPDFWRAYYNRGLANFFLKRYPEALRDFNAAANMRPQPPDLYYFLGGVHAGLGQLEAAYLNYTRAISEGGGNASRAYYERASVSKKLGRQRTASLDRQAVD